MPDGTDNTGAAQGGAGQAGDGSQGSAAQGDEGKLTFTPEELQAHTDKTLNKRFGEIQTAAEAKNKAEMDTLNARIKELETGKGGDDKHKGTDGKGEDVTAIKEELAIARKEREQSREMDRTTKILSVVNEFDTINSEQVATLIGPDIKRMEDGKLVVHNSQGQIRLNGEGQRLTVKERVEEFLKVNAHLVKAGGGTGGGSHGAGPGGPVGGVKFATAQEVRDMSNEDFDKAMVEGVSIPGSGGQVYNFKMQENKFAIKK